MSVIDKCIEITLPDEKTFLKIKETLTRIGIASKKDKTLYQSCHILHKKGKYYIVHFKQLFELDGKKSDFSKEDEERLQTIALLLEKWKLCSIVKKETLPTELNMNLIKIISFAEKDEWNLVSKYNIGKVKN